MSSPLTRKQEKRQVEVLSPKSPAYVFFVQILSHFVEQRILVSDLTKDESINYPALATVTEGYAALDLKDLVSRAVQNAAERSLADANGRLDYAAVSTSEIPHLYTVDHFVLT